LSKDFMYVNHYLYENFKTTSDKSTTTMKIITIIKR